jgi:hypothetical protein
VQVDDVILVEQLGELVPHDNLTEHRGAAVVAEVIPKLVLLRA